MRRQRSCLLRSVSGLFIDPHVVADNRAHGLDERIGVKEFCDRLEFTYRPLKALANALPLNP